MRSDLCEIACMIPNYILSMKHCYGMSHLARSNPHQHGSHYPHQSLDCAGINPPAPPLWKHTHNRECCSGDIYTQVWVSHWNGSVCADPVNRAQWKKWVQSPHRWFPTDGELL